MLFNFNIVKIYSSITHQNLKNSKNYKTISDNDFRLIKQTSNSILVHDKNIWLKRDENIQFDVPMELDF